MKDNLNEQDIETLSRLHHEFYYKTLHSNLEDNYPKIKGLAPLEMNILHILSDNPSAMLKEISDELDIPKSTLTSLVDKLERRGYVQRAISSKDRRSFQLELTQDGKLAQKEHLECEREVYFKILNALDSDDEIQTFIRLLRKIADQF